MAIYLTDAYEYDGVHYGRRAAIPSGDKSARRDDEPCAAVYASIESVPKHSSFFSDIPVFKYLVSIKEHIKVFFCSDSSLKFVESSNKVFSNNCVTPQSSSRTTALAQNKNILEISNNNGAILRQPSLTQSHLNSPVKTFLQFKKKELEVSSSNSLPKNSSVKSTFLFNSESWEMNANIV